MLTQYLLTRFRRSFHSREQLEAWQDLRVQKHIREVLKHSPFYREHFGSLSPDEWRHFPTIDKTVMMEHFDRLNTAGIKKAEAFQLAMRAEESRDFTPTIRGITIGLSSGTSGNRGLFLVSEKERYRWAGTMLAKLLPGSLLDRHHIAFFLRANSNLYTSVERGRIQFRFFDLLRPVKEHIEQLNSFQPTILVGPPSMLRFLAEQQQLQQLNIHPQKVISVAEVLDPLDEAVISRAFQQTVHQVYQCTEGFLAVTCPYGTLHINEDIVVIQKEMLDPDTGKFSPIITDFSRWTQPILRYRLNDILTERKTPCPCGSVFLAIEQIEGRCDDLFYFRSLSSDQLVPVFPDFIRRAIITADEEIEEYLAIQHSPEQVEISLRTAAVNNRGPIRQNILASLEKLCDHLGCLSPSVRFTSYSRKPGATKLRRVERKFPLQQ
ncbi:adenylate cyclase [Paenactinomyces guangxiensis]|uniref:Adenylate cyclase n=2 Tax=Paenactinomyces guangxiensis TaxID=1490290 RepID=A0A7W2A6H8_9BACL|nr:F390 synthetase-related protein [Paenactinomyces guangxiensis]MBA4493396.1 adenylate cyclase [Paenactinomyces guangxiensis]